MDSLLHTILLGIIEGITEFLPISSTGHLLIAEKLGLGARSEVFNVVIQAGAILAVTVIYWQRLWNLLLGFRQPENRDYALKLIVAFVITAALGLIATKAGFKLTANLHRVAWGLILGSVWILGAEWLAAKRSEQAKITWAGALAVGIAQIVAGLFPGVSRSGATIFSTMLIGSTSRVASTEFSFLVGIPTMYAASATELYKALKAGGAAENWSQLAVGFVVSAVVAFIVVKWLLHYIQSHRFTIFAWYRIVVGALLLLLV